LELERRGSTLIVWLHRPPVNALNREMAIELNEVLDSTTADPNIRALVFTSRLKAFCGGADLKMALDFDRMEMAQWTFLLQRTYDRLERLPLPTIAAVNGAAAGGGLELALACDIRVIAPDAFVALPEARRGILPGAGGTQRLARMIGYGRAIEIMITGRSIPAAEALQIGLAHRLAEDVVAAALEFAQQFESVSSPSIGEIKQCLLGGITGGYWNGSILEAMAADRLMNTAEYKEGIRSFLEHRPPDFSHSQLAKQTGGAEPDEAALSTKSP
jgi:enoyl-CoA hydratase